MPLRHRYAHPVLMASIGIHAFTSLPGHFHMITIDSQPHRAHEQPDDIQRLVNLPIRHTCNAQGYRPDYLGVAQMKDGLFVQAILSQKRVNPSAICVNVPPCV